MAKFGEIEGVKVGDIFKNRAEVKAAGLHAQTQAGISGAAYEGADAIILNEGYEDDEDEGDVILYTGQGGRDTSTGHQITPPRKSSTCNE